MSPSVRRRKRPRERSISFHTLWWLVRREAVVRIVFATPGDQDVEWLRARRDVLRDWPWYKRYALRRLDGPGRGTPFSR